MEKLEHHFAHVNGVNLHYVTAGEGKPVILLHGFPEFWYGWKNQIPSLSKYFKVIAPDMRGYNESEKPQKISDYAADIVAQDIAELIKFLGYEKAHIVGHDWGGAIAWTLGQKQPQVIEKLAVLNCPLPQIMQKQLLTNFTQLRRSWYILFFQLPRLPELYITRDLPLFFKRGLRGWAKNKKAFSDEDIQKYVEAFEKPGAVTAAINYYRASFRNPLKFSGGNKNITNDTLMIWGENDKALGKELTFGMEKYFNGKFEIRYISNCSHWVQHDHPQLVNEWLIEFLNA